MKRWPLRTRLVLWTVLVGGLSVALFGGIIALSLKSKLRHQLDVTLRSEGESVFAGVAQLGHPMKWGNPAEVAKLFTSVISLYSFEIEQPPGTLVYRSKDLGNMPLPTGEDGVAFTGTIGPSDTARVLQLGSDTMRLRVAVDLSPFN